MAKLPGDPPSDPARPVAPSRAPTPALVDLHFAQPLDRLAHSAPGQPCRVAVWAALVADLIAPCQAVPTLLTADEATRAARFVQPRDRDTYLVAHTLCRALLALATGLPPRSLVWLRGPFGKPYLDHSASLPSTPRWQFNLSHTSGYVMVALCRDVEVGVDIESLRPHLELPGIAERFFSPEEVACWKAGPPARQVEMFYRLWTRKEAFMKAAGLGFGLSLDSFAVEADPTRPPRLLRTPPHLPGCDHWSVHDLTDALLQLVSPPVPCAALVAAAPTLDPTLHFVSGPALASLLQLLAASPQPLP